MEFIIDFNSLSQTAKDEIITQVNEAVVGGKTQLDSLNTAEKQELQSTSVDFISRNIGIIARLPKDGLDMIVKREAIKIKKE